MACSLSNRGRKLHVYAQVIKVRYLDLDLESPNHQDHKLVRAPIFLNVNGRVMLMISSLPNKKQLISQKTTFLKWLTVVKKANGNSCTVCRCALYLDPTLFANTCNCDIDNKKKETADVSRYQDDVFIISCWTEG